MKALMRIAITGGVVCLLILLGFLVQLDLMGAPDGIPVQLFLWLVGLGAAAGIVLAAGTSAESPRAWPALSSSAASTVDYACAACAVLCAAISGYMVHTGGSEATAFWILGMGLALLAARSDVLAGARGVAAQFARVKTDGVGRIGWPIPVLLLILLVAAALRLPALDSTPPFVHFDEAGAGLQARALVDGQVSSIFTFGYGTLPMLASVWNALFFRLFGDNLIALRLSSVTAGLGSIVLLALLGKEIFNWRAGLLGAALLSLAFYHIHYSRIGMPNIQAVFTAVLTLYLLICALRYASRLAAVGTGIALSLDLQIYFAGRVMILLVPVLLAYIVLVSERRLWRTRLNIILWLVIGAIVGLLPPAVLFADNWAQFALRTREVLVVGGDPTVQHVVATQIYMTTDPVYILRTNLWRAIQTYFYLGNTSDHFLTFHPILDPMSAALLIPSLVYAACHMLRTGFGILLIMFIAILISGGMLTIDQPDWDRIVFIVPVIILLIGAFLDALWQCLQQIPYASIPTTLATTALLLVIGNGNYQYYFDQFQQSMLQSDMSPSLVVATYLQSIHDHPYVYMYTAIRDLSIDSMVLQFLVPNIQGCSAPTDTAFHRCPHLTKGDRIVITDISHIRALGAIRRLFPHGQLSKLPGSSPSHALYVYRVPG